MGWGVGGIYVYIQVIHFVVQQTITQHCKAVLSLFSHWVTFNSFVTPWIVAHQGPLSMGFPRQEYWSRLPFPSPGIFLTQGSNLSLLHWQAESLSLRHQGCPKQLYFQFFFKKKKERKEKTGVKGSSNFHSSLNQCFLGFFGRGDGHCDRC